MILYCTFPYVRIIISTYGLRIRGVIPVSYTHLIEAAIRGNADMLVTHHPLIFSPLKTVTDEHFISNRVVKLLQHDISYYAMHTNYDVLGMAELSGKMMELVQVEPLEVTIPENNQGIGRVGFLKHEMTLGECCELVKEKFHLPDVKVFGDIERLSLIHILKS